jgi:hypothetical protein
VAGNQNQAFTPLQLPQFKLEDLGHGEDSDKALAFFNQWASAIVQKVNAHSKSLQEHTAQIAAVTPPATKK